MDISLLFERNKGHKPSTATLQMPAKKQFFESVPYGTPSAAKGRESGWGNWE
jgi:hypothetical protein